MNILNNYLILFVSFVSCFGLIQADGRSVADIEAWARIQLNNTNRPDEMIKVWKQDLAIQIDAIQTNKWRWLNPYTVGSLIYTGIATWCFSQRNGIVNNLIPKYEKTIQDITSKTADLEIAFDRLADQQIRADILDKVGLNQRVVVDAEEIHYAIGVEEWNTYDSKERLDYIYPEDWNHYPQKGVNQRVYADEVVYNDLGIQYVKIGRNPSKATKQEAFDFYQNLLKTKDSISTFKTMGKLFTAFAAGAAVVGTVCVCLAYKKAVDSKSKDMARQREILEMLEKLEAEYLAKIEQCTD